MATAATAEKVKPGQRLDDYTLLIPGEMLSDLFFNFGHEHYGDAVAGAHKAGRAATSEELIAAVSHDAHEFALCVNMTEDEQFKAALVRDFLARV